jgi:hypothetical protein
MQLTLHDSTVAYRIIFRPGSWKMKSTRHFTAFHSTEAFHDIYYGFKNNRIHAKSISIHKVEEFNRFSGKWDDRTDIVRDFISEYAETYPLATINKKKINLVQDNS